MQLSKREQQLVKQFNQPDTHLVISHWPSKTGSFDGIATYTQDTVEKLAAYSQDKFVVLAEGQKFALEKINKNILVVRAFDEKHLHLYPRILSWLNHFNLIKEVTIHSEFCASGGPSLRLLMVPFLGLIKLAGRRITFYAHNVVTNFVDFAPHFGKKKDDQMIKLWAFGYRAYLAMTSLFVDKFVVLEEVIRKRLQPLVGKKEIVVHPHWIAGAKQKISKQQARRALGLDARKEIVVSFGFVTYYKGADFVADFAKWTHQNKKLKQTQFVLAGGPAHSLQDKDYYKEYYASIEKTAAYLPNLILTGFLKEEDVALWLSAADLVVFPYRNLMGGSGALQQALMYGNPVMLSKEMAASMDIADQSVIFVQNYQVLHRKIKNFFSQAACQTEVQAFSKNLASKLAIENLIADHYSDVYAPAKGSFSCNSFASQSSL
jgi:glycosyltransferase involved in cell wall biosynthesis